MFWTYSETKKKTPNIASETSIATRFAPLDGPDQTPSSRAARRAKAKAQGRAAAPITKVPRPPEPMTS